MSRQGRILVIENDERWREAVSDTLRRAGFQADTAGTASEARAALRSKWYHLAVLDIRLDDDESDNDTEGLKLLNDEIIAASIRDAMMVIVLSAFGTKAQMRDSFKRGKVVDFLDKADFNNLKFRDQVQEIFKSTAHLNLGLKVHWQHTAGPEQVVINLRYHDRRVKNSTPEQSRAAEELDDLLCRLFYKAESVLIEPLKPGQSGAAVLSTQPFYTTGPGQRVIVKFGDFRSIDKEYENFEQYIQPLIGGRRNTNVVTLRRTTSLGGIVYSLLGSDHDRVESFANFYATASIEAIKEVLTRLLIETCGPWYANPGRLQLCDLTETGTILA